MGRSKIVRECLRWAGFLAIAFALLLGATSASAQEAGSILGVVKDTSGGSVPEAKVTITNTDTNDARTVTTGDDGAFRVPGLKPGRYTVKVEKEGFKTSSQTSLTLNVADQLVVNPSMEVGSATQEVTVTGEAPIVNTTTSSLGGLVNDQQIAELPLNGRNYTDLTLLQPGVTSTTHSGLGDAGIWYSSNGASPRSNNYMIDGALMVTQNGTGPAGMTGNTLGVDGIKEYKVVTSMFSAEYGLLMGSQMVIVSKGGSNNWHGGVFEYLRNNHLDARNFFDPQPSLANHILVNGDGTLARLPQFKRNNFGGSFGGPVKKDKTFFWLVYEGLRLSQGDTIQDTTAPAACHFLNTPGGPVIAGGGPIPSGTTLPAGFTAANQRVLRTPITGATLATAGCGNAPAGTAVASVVTPWLGQFPFPNETGASNYTLGGFTRGRDDYGQLRVDHNLTANDNLFMRYTFDDARITTPYLGGNLSAVDTGTGYPQFSNLGLSRNQYGTLGENHIFTPNLLNSLRISFSRTYYFNDFVNNMDPGLNPNFTLSDPTNCATSGGCVFSAVPGLTTAGFTPGSGITALVPPGTFPNYHIQNVWTVMDDIFYTKGKHAFKFGTMLNRFNDPNLQSKSIFGVINFANLYTPAAGATPASGFIAGVPSSISVVLPGQSVALQPGVPGATLLAPPYQGNFLDRNIWFNTVGLYLQDDYRATNRLTVNLGLRYEFRTAFTETYNRLANVVDIQHSTNSTIGAFSTNPTYKNFSPRIGFAWDVFGNGKTALRSGFGVYYDVGNYGALLTQNPTGMVPFVANTTIQYSPSLGAITLPLNPNLGGAGRSLQTNDYNAKSPHSMMFNMTVSQQLPLGVGLDVSYVGRRGLNLYTGLEGNPVRPLPGTGVNGIPAQYNVTNGQAGCQNNTIPVDSNGIPQPFTIGGVVIPSTDPRYPCRTNPFFTSAQFFTNAAESWYNALQVAVNKKLGHGLMFQAAYTYSRATDDTQGTRFNDDCGGNSGSAFGQNPTQLQLDWGLSCYDVTHSMHFNLLYHLPNFTSNAFAGKVVNGWWLSSIVSVQGGSPFRAIVNQDRSFSGIITQSNVMSASLNTQANTQTFNLGSAAAPQNVTYNFVPFDPKTVITGDPNHWFNPLMFGEAPLGQLSNQPRNIIRNPGLGNLDLSLVKDTKVGFLGEGGNVQFRAEFFNLLNRANFGFLNAGASVFSGITSGATANVCVNNQQCNVQPPNGATAANPLGTAGQISTTATTSRQIQLAIKVNF